MSEEKVYFEGEFDSDDGGRTPKAVRFCATNLAANLTGFRLYNPYKPLRDVYVLRASDRKLPEIIRDAYKKWNPSADPYKWDTQRYNGLKPEWVRAFMTKDDLKFSRMQATLATRNATLATIIRARGMQRIGKEPEYDDCGHVVAKWLGGPFVDYNLFPQSFALNRGNSFWGLPNFNLWKAMEMFMFLWLRLKKNAKVEWTVRHYYKDTAMVDRPSETTFYVRFLAGEDKEDDKQDNGRDVVKVVRHLFNTSQAALQKKKTQVRVSETYEVLSALCVRNAAGDELLRCLLKLVKEIEVEVEEENLKKEEDLQRLKHAADVLNDINPIFGIFWDLANRDFVKAGEQIVEEDKRKTMKGILLGTIFGRPGK